MGRNEFKNKKFHFTYEWWVEIKMGVGLGEIQRIKIGVRRLFGTQEKCFNGRLNSRGIFKNIS